MVGCSFETLERGATTCNSKLLNVILVNYILDYMKWLKGRFSPKKTGVYNFAICLLWRVFMLMQVLVRLSERMLLLKSKYVCKHTRFCLHSFLYTCSFAKILRGFLKFSISTFALQLTNLL